MDAIDLETATMQSPTISILMSVFNGAQYVSDAIGGILAQTFRDWELIIIDDCSTDKTPELIGRVRDDRIRIMRNSQNLGLTRSLNLGLEYASGKYIARQDADDISLPRRLETQLEFLRLNPEVGLLGTSIITIDAASRITGQSQNPLTNTEIQVDALVRNHIAHGSVVMRRAVIDVVGTYDSRFVYAQDYELWLRLMQHFEVANLSAPLYLRRMHPAAISQQQRNAQSSFVRLAARQAAKRYLAASPDSLQAKALGRYYLQEGLQALAKADDRRALDYITQAYQKDPSLSTAGDVWKKLIGWYFLDILDTDVPYADASNLLLKIRTMLPVGARPAEEILKSLMRHFFHASLQESLQTGNRRQTIRETARMIRLCPELLHKRGVQSLIAKGIMGATDMHI